MIGCCLFSREIKQVCGLPIQHIVMNVISQEHLDHGAHTSDQIKGQCHCNCIYVLLL